MNVIRVVVVATLAMAASRVVAQSPQMQLFPSSHRFDAKVRLVTMGQPQPPAPMPEEVTPIPMPEANAADDPFADEVLNGQRIDGANAAARGCPPGGCPQGGCLDGACGGCFDCCLTPVWAHSTEVYGEFLYLRARDAEVAYGQPIDGPIVDPDLPVVQIGSTGVVDPNYDPGFRFGFNYALDDCASLRVEYTLFESNSRNEIAINAPDVIRSLVAHPAAANAATDVLLANATLGVDFETIDVDYRRLLDGGDLHAINYLIGFRYARIDQDFESQFSRTGDLFVDANTSFEGAGIRLGLEGERHAPCSGFLVYAKANSSFVAGEARARYVQDDTFGGPTVFTDFEAGRVVTTLDVEIGAGWESKCRRWRATAGYTVSAWMNVITTDEYIDAVQRNNFVGLNDTVTFDGFTSRLTFRF